MSSAPKKVYKCFTCGEEGHFSPQCPKKGDKKPGGPPSCYNCKEVGHLSTHCPKPKVAKAPYVKKTTQYDSSSMSSKNPTGARKDAICYGCKQKGHFKSQCPELAQQVQTQEQKEALEKKKAESKLKRKAEEYKTLYEDDDGYKSSEIDEYELSLLLEEEQEEAKASEQARLLEEATVQKERTTIKKQKTEAKEASSSGPPIHPINHTFESYNESLASKKAPPKKEKEKKEDVLLPCLFCNDKPAIYACMPCKHQCMCVECHVKLYHGSMCPLCSAFVDGAEFVGIS